MTRRWPGSSSASSPEHALGCGKLDDGRQNSATAPAVTNGPRSLSLSLSLSLCIQTVYVHLHSLQNLTIGHAGAGSGAAATSTL